MKLYINLGLHNLYLQLIGGSGHFVTLFDGICDQTKELQTLTGSMSDGVKWLISSSGRYMFVKYQIDTYGSIYGSYTGFNAKIHYSKDTPN